MDLPPPKKAKTKKQALLQFNKKAERSVTGLVGWYSRQRPSHQLHSGFFRHILSSTASAQTASWWWNKQTHTTISLPLDALSQHNFQPLRFFQPQPVFQILLVYSAFTHPVTLVATDKKGNFVSHKVSTRNATVTSSNQQHSSLHHCSNMWVTPPHSISTFCEHFTCTGNNH